MANEVKHESRERMEQGKLTFLLSNDVLLEAVSATLLVREQLQTLFDRPRNRISREVR